MAKFLTKEWLEALTETINDDPGFTSAIEGVELRLQFEIPDAPEGTESTYSIAIADGHAEATPGPLEDAHATITNDYATAVALSKGELNTQTAFMTGKLKVSGDMTQILKHQAVFGAFATASSAVDVEY